MLTRHTAVTAVRAPGPQKARMSCTYILHHTHTGTAGRGVREVTKGDDTMFFSNLSHFCQKIQEKYRIYSIFMIKGKIYFVSNIETRL